jgi:hypothetical protein
LIGGVALSSILVCTKYARQLAAAISVLLPLPSWFLENATRQYDLRDFKIAPRLTSQAALVSKNYSSTAARQGVGTKHPCIPGSTRRPPPQEIAKAPPRRPHPTLTPVVCIKAILWKTIVC